MTLPFRVHLDVRQAVLLEHAHERLRARLLLEWRRRDLGQRDELADEPFLVGLDEGGGLFERAPRR